MFGELSRMKLDGSDGSGMEVKLDHRQAMGDATMTRVHGTFLSGDWGDGLALPANAWRLLPHCRGHCMYPPSQTAAHLIVHCH